MVNAIADTQFNVSRARNLWKLVQLESKKVKEIKDELNVLSREIYQLNKDLTTSQATLNRLKNTNTANRGVSPNDRNDLVRSSELIKIANRLLPDKTERFTEQKRALNHYSTMLEQHEDELNDVLNTAAKAISDKVKELKTDCAKIKAAPPVAKTILDRISNLERVISGQASKAAQELVKADFNHRNNINAAISQVINAIRDVNERSIKEFNDIEKDAPVELDKEYENMWKTEIPAFLDAEIKKICIAKNVGNLTHQEVIGAQRLMDEAFINTKGSRWKNYDTEKNNLWTGIKARAENRTNSLNTMRDIETLINDNRYRYLRPCDRDVIVRQACKLIDMSLKQRNTTNGETVQTVEARLDAALGQQRKVKLQDWQRVFGLDKLEPGFVMVASKRINCVALNTEIGLHISISLASLQGVNEQVDTFTKAQLADRLFLVTWHKRVHVSYEHTSIGSLKPFEKPKNPHLFWGDGQWDNEYNLPSNSAARDEIKTEMKNYLAALKTSIENKCQEVINMDGRADLVTPIVYS